jgi:hypothetical protein
MSASLTLRYEFSASDDFGWLEVKVRTSRICGVGGFWVQWQDLEEWAAKLVAYPLNGAVEADWGQRPSGGDYQTIVGILLSPAGTTGELEVRVALADRDDLRFRCETAFSTHYPDLERFAAALSKMMKREADEAVLLGVDLD